MEMQTERMCSEPLQAGLFPEMRVYMQHLGRKAILYDTIWEGSKGICYSRLKGDTKTLMQLQTLY